MTAPAAFAEAVAAVEHDADCNSRHCLGVSHPHLAQYFGRCNCDRDARIAKGVEEVRASDDSHGRISLVECGCGVPMNDAYWREHRNAAAYAAFVEASRG